MIFPMIISDTRYVDRWHDSGSASAVRSLQTSQDSNHRELMGAVKKLGEQKLAVTVVGTEILPSAKAAFDYLDGPCRDYDKAYSAWCSRYYEVKSYLKERKEREKDRARQAKIDAYRAENLPSARQKDAKAHVRGRSLWFSGLPYHEAYKLVERGECPTPAVDKVMAWTPDRDLYDMEWMFEQKMEMFKLSMEPRGKSAPIKPDGHGYLAAIREVYEAAQAAPNAMLTIPADTVRAIGKFSGLSGKVIEDSCDSCGSKNFLRIGAVRVCSYCRSET